MFQLPLDRDLLASLCELTRLFLCARLRRSGSPCLSVQGCATPRLTSYPGKETEMSLNEILYDKYKTTSM